MGLSLKNIGRKIEDFLGGAVDAVIPGDQGFLHHQGQAPQFIQSAENAVAPVARRVAGSVVHAAPAVLGRVVSPFGEATQDVSGVVAPTIKAAVSQIGPSVKPITSAANDFIQGQSQGAGQAGYNAIKGLSTLGAAALDPILPGDQKQQNSDIWNQADAYGSRNFQAPAPGAQSAGYVSGSALAEVPKFYAGAKGAQIAGDAASIVPKVSSIIKPVVESAGGVIPYDVLSNRTKPQDLATDTALGIGADLGIRGAAAGIKAAAPAVKRAVVSLKNDPYLGNERGTVGGPSAMNPRDSYTAVDGVQRFNISDQGAKVNQVPPSNKTYPLGAVLDHPQLYNQYPGLENTQVQVNGPVKLPDMLNVAQKAILDREQSVPGMEPASTGGLPAVGPVLNPKPPVRFAKYLANEQGKLGPGEVPKDQPQPQNPNESSSNNTPPENLDAIKERVAKRTASPTGPARLPNDPNFQAMMDGTTPEVTKRPKVKLNQDIPKETVNKYAETLSVSKKQAQRDLSEAPSPTITMGQLEKSIKNNRNLSYQGMSDVGREHTQEAIDRENSVVNNPALGKVSIHAIQPGDYMGARNLPGRVTNPLKTMEEQAAQAVGKLNKADRQRFWRDYVEDPQTISTAKSPKKVQKAVAAWRQYADQAHASDRALGGRTGYLDRYALGHNWDLSNSADLQKFNSLIGQDVAPEDFRGINNQPRVFQSIKEGEMAGFKRIPTDPVADIRQYGRKLQGGLRRQALIKGMTEADAVEQAKNGLGNGLLLGRGDTLRLSQRGTKEAKAFQAVDPKTGKVVSGYDAINGYLKGTLLSVSQFHTANIGGLRVAPTLALKGHPVAAVKSVVKPIAVLAPGGKRAVNLMYQRAINDGMVDKAAQIGMPYPTASQAEGMGLSRGLGHKTVFEKQLPMIHDELARSIIHDLEKRNIPLNSPDALRAGLVGNELMGHMNAEVQNITPGVRRGFQRLFLASQFTPSKGLLVKDALTKGGVAGSYARRGVVGNVAAVAAVATGVGYLMHQKSDDTIDVLLRALVDPAVPTPLKDDNGNTIKLRMPGTDTSDISKLIGLKLVRGADDHLHVSWNPKNMPSTVTDFLRARLAPLPGDAIKLVTNSNYAGHPLFDSGADPKTQAIEAATSLGLGSLPIGLQGLASSDKLTSHLPDASKLAIEQANPGSPLKSLGSSFGFTPATDQTTGKGLETSQYFDTRNRFYNSLDTNEQSLFNKLEPKKKGYAGQTIFESDVLTNPSKYADLIDNQDFFNKYQAYQQSQHGHDPMWDYPPDVVKAYMLAQVISKFDPGGDSASVNALYDKVPQSFYDDRTAHFNALKSQGVQLASSGVQAPQESSDLRQFGTYVNSLPKGTGQRTAAYNTATGQQYLNYLDQKKAYNNQQRAALGLPPLPDTTSSYSSGSSKSGSKKTYTKKAKLTRAKGGSSNSSKVRSAGSAYKYAVSITAGGGKVKGASTRVKKVHTSTSTRPRSLALPKPGKKARVATRVTLSKPKVALKPSRV